AIGFAVLAWLVLGQREHLFGFGLIWLLLAMYRLTGAQRLCVLWAAVIAFAMVEPITQNFKSFLVGERRHDVLRREHFLYPAPYSGAARNLAELFQTDMTISRSEVIRRELLRPMRIMG